jgi:hypothetical protein
MPSNEAAPRWVVRLISEFNAADERATALAKTLTARQLNWKPRPEVWSVGQCLEHLSVANEVYLDAISKSLVPRQHAVVQEITPGRFSRWFIGNYIEASSRTKRARAPRKIAPGVEISPDILERFVRSNATARQVIDRARHYDVNRIRFTNPFVPVIRFTVGTGLEIISRHESRHLLQAERIRASAEFPVS